MAQHIFAIHDPGGQHLIIGAGKSGWTVFTEAIGSESNDHSGKDFRQWALGEINAIVRLNNGYAPAGTIPTSDRYQDFAQRCVNYVRASAGATRWIIGNEPNLPIERPGGQVITPAMYAQCFGLCREAIRRVAPGAEVIVGAVGPWNNQTVYPGNESGDWVRYLQDVLALVQCDGVALHTYTHGPDPALIASEAMMDAPFDRYHYHFRAYQDFAKAIQPGLPIYITESNQNDPWLDQANGWVPAAYAEIDSWNQANRDRQIYCLALYRWPPFDQWVIETKPGVQNDFKTALQHDYRPLPPSMAIEPQLRLAWPVPPGTPISQGFSDEHNGIDFACPMRTPITAAADGVVTMARYDESGYGLHVQVDHGDAYTLYAHLSEVAFGVGQSVNQKQLIAWSGNTGHSTGPHLHFGFRKKSARRDDRWGGYSPPPF